MKERLDCRELMAAVLDRAVRDVRETHGLPPPVVPVLSKEDRSRNSEGLRAFNLGLEVRSWFASDRHGLFSFRGICDAMNVNAHAVLGGLAPHMEMISEREWREYEAGGVGWRKSA